MLHTCSSTDSNLFQAASTPVLQEIQTKSRSNVSLDKLELFCGPEAVGSYPVFVVFDPNQSELLSQGTLILLARLDA